MGQPVFAAKKQPKKAAKFAPPKPPKETQAASALLARFQRAILRSDLPGLTALLAPEAQLNGRKLTPPLNLGPPLGDCSLWASLKAHAPDQYAGVIKHYGDADASILTQEFQRSVGWIQAKNFHGWAALAQTDRLYVVDQSGTHFTRLVCVAPPATAHGLFERIVHVNPTSFAGDEEWLKQRRVWTFYGSLMPSMFSRVWHAFFNSTSQDAVTAWAPLAKATSQWLQETSQASTPTGSVDRELQEMARAILPRLNQLRPDLSASELTFLQKFFLEDVFAVASDVFVLARLMALWHFKSLPSADKATAHWDLFMKEQKVRLQECCFDEKGFKALDKFDWQAPPSTSEGIPLPPPVPAQ